MKQKEPVTISLLKTIIRNYPVVPSHLIHSAGRYHCLSGGQRLRDLRKWHCDILRYSYGGNKYFFNATPKSYLKDILKFEEAYRGIK